MDVKKEPVEKSPLKQNGDNNMMDIQLTETGK